MRCDAMRLGRWDREAAAGGGEGSRDRSAGSDRSDRYEPLHQRSATDQDEAIR